MKNWRVARDADSRRTRWMRSTSDSALTLDGSPQINFCDNDYLGLSQDERLSEALLQAARRYGVSAAASPLITGYTEAHESLEATLAEFTGRDRALVFSSGYLTNLGCVSALTSRSDTVLEDRRNHASLLDAVSLSAATRHRYHHADATHAAQLLEESGADMILTDGVFSMDGDTAPLADLASLARSHSALLLCDDAHGLGVLGEHGGGLLEECELSQDDVPLLIGTLGKAFGAQGGFAAGPAALIEHLLQYARTYTYDTALSPALASAAECGVRLLMDEPEHLHRLHRNIQHFRQHAGQSKLPLTESHTAIQPIVLGDAETTMQASHCLWQRGFAVRAIRPPTVAKGHCCLRITLSARHTLEQIDHLTKALADCLEFDKLHPHDPAT